MVIYDRNNFLFNSHLSKVRKNYRDQPYLTKLGQRIIDLRLIKNMSRLQMANISGLEEKTIRRIEKAETNVTISILKLIAETLDISVSEMLDFD